MNIVIVRVPGCNAWLASCYRCGVGASSILTLKVLWAIHYTAAVSWVKAVPGHCWLWASGMWPKAFCVGDHVEEPMAFCTVWFMRCSACTSHSHRKERCRWYYKNCTPFSLCILLGHHPPLCESSTGRRGCSSQPPDGSCIDKNQRDDARRRGEKEVWSYSIQSNSCFPDGWRWQFGGVIPASARPAWLMVRLPLVTGPRVGSPLAFPFLQLCLSQV